MMDVPNLLRLLTEHEVAFIIIGGVAAVIHGSSRLTQDLDVVYQRTPQNMRRLVQALVAQSPYLRGDLQDSPSSGQKLPSVWD